MDRIELRRGTDHRVIEVARENPAVAFEQARMVIQEWANDGYREAPVIATPPAAPAAPLAVVPKAKKSAPRAKGKAPAKKGKRRAA